MWQGNCNHNATISNIVLVLDTTISIKCDKYERFSRKCILDPLTIIKSHLENCLSFKPPCLSDIIHDKKGKYLNFMRTASAFDGTLYGIAKVKLIIMLYL
jgi:hypothetical protein